MGVIQPLSKLVVSNGKLILPEFDRRVSALNVIDTAACLTASHIFRSPTKNQDEFKTRFLPETESISDGKLVDYNNRKWQPVEAKKALLFFNYLYFDQVLEKYDSFKMLEKPLQRPTGGEFRPITELERIDQVVWGYLLRLKCILGRLGMQVTIMNLPSDLPYGRVEKLAEERERLYANPFITKVMHQSMDHFGLTNFQPLAIQDPKVQDVFTLLRKQRHQGGRLSTEELQRLEEMRNGITDNTMLFGPENAFKSKAQKWLDKLISGGLEKLVEEVYPGGVEAWKAKNERKGYAYEFVRDDEGGYSFNLINAKDGTVSLQIEVGNKKANGMTAPYCPLILCAVLRRTQQLGFSHFVGGFHSKEAEMASMGVVLSKHIFGGDLKHYIMEFDKETGEPISSSNGQLAFKYHEDRTVGEMNIQHMKKLFRDEREYRDKEA